MDPFPNQIKIKVSARCFGPSFSRLLSSLYVAIFLVSHVCDPWHAAGFRKPHSALRQRRVSGVLFRRRESRSTSTAAAAIWAIESRSARRARTHITHARRRETVQPEWNSSRRSKANKAREASPAKLQRRRRRRAKTIIDSFASKLPPRTYIKTVAPPQTLRLTIFCLILSSSADSLENISKYILSRQCFWATWNPKMYT